jgi:hypothetical protein
MDELFAGPPAWYEWNGIRWRRNRNGYYQDDNGNLLHRELWRSHVGPLTEDVVLHHIDHDKANNKLDNLRPVSRSEHCAEHPEKWTDERWMRMQTSEGARDRASLLWANRKPQDIRCAQCGTVFQSTGMRAKFCGGTCRARHRRAQRRAELDASGYIRSDR